MLKCPRDGALLQPVNALGVTLDRCDHCGGLWCDTGELERLRELDVSDVENQIELQCGDARQPAGTVEAYMRCPRCTDARLQGITITLTKRVRVDRCESCLGIWLDKNELNAVIAERHSISDTPRRESNERLSAEDHAVHASMVGLFQKLGTLFRR